MPRARFTAGIIAAAAVAVTAPALAVSASTEGPTATASATTKTVRLKDVRFTPSTVRVRVGDAVKWVWADGSIEHTVTSEGSRRFKDAESSVARRKPLVVRFRKAGTYRYVCTNHRFQMTGKVVVRR